MVPPGAPQDVIFTDTRYTQGGLSRSSNFIVLPPDPLSIGIYAIGGQIQINFPLTGGRVLMELIRYAAGVGPAQIIATDDRPIIENAVTLLCSTQFELFNDDILQLRVTNVSNPGNGNIPPNADYSPEFYCAKIG